MCSISFFFRMADEEKFSFKNLVDHLDRNELNAECQRWALCHGKCPDLDMKFLSNLHII
jgi:hypothetical protein